MLQTVCFLIKIWCSGEVMRAERQSEGVTRNIICWYTLWPVFCLEFYYLPHLYKQHYICLNKSAVSDHSVSQPEITTSLFHTQHDCSSCRSCRCLRPSVTWEESQQAHKFNHVHQLMQTDLSIHPHRHQLAEFIKVIRGDGNNWSWFQFSVP